MLFLFLQGFFEGWGAGNEDSRVLFDLYGCKESAFALTPAVRAGERLNSLALGRSKTYTEKFFCL